MGSSRNRRTSRGDEYRRRRGRINNSTGSLHNIRDNTAWYSDSLRDNTADILRNCNDLHRGFCLPWRSDGLVNDTRVMDLDHFSLRIHNSHLLPADSNDLCYGHEIRNSLVRDVGQGSSSSLSVDGLDNSRGDLRLDETSGSSSDGLLFAIDSCHERHGTQTRNGGLDYVGGSDCLPGLGDSLLDGVLNHCLDEAGGGVGDCCAVAANSSDLGDGAEGSNRVCHDVDFRSGSIWLDDSLLVGSWNDGSDEAGGGVRDGSVLAANGGDLGDGTQGRNGGCYAFDLGLGVVWTDDGFLVRSWNDGGDEADCGFCNCRLSAVDGGYLRNGTERCDCGCDSFYLRSSLAGFYHGLFIRYWNNGSDETGGCICDGLLFAVDGSNLCHGAERRDC